MEHKHDTERAIVDLPSLASYTDYVQDERTRFESLVAEIVRSTATVVISTQVRRAGLRAPATPQNRAIARSHAHSLCVRAVAEARKHTKPCAYLSLCQHSLFGHPGSSANPNPTLFPLPSLPPSLPSRVLVTTPRSCLRMQASCRSAVSRATLCEISLRHQAPPSFPRPRSYIAQLPQQAASWFRCWARVARSRSFMQALQTNGTFIHCHGSNPDY